MASVEDAIGALKSLPHKPDQFGTRDFERVPSIPDESSTVAEIQVQRLVTLRAGGYDLDLVAYESFPSDSTTGDADTFEPSHYPMQTESVAGDFVLYAGGEKVPESEYTVNWDASPVTFDYSGDETTDDLHAFYVSRQQARYELRKVAPNGTYEKLDEGDLSLANRQNSNRDPLSFDPDHALQGVIPAFWKLQVRVDGPYTVRWGVDVDGDDEQEATADQMLVDLPINRATTEAPEFVEGVVAALAGRN
jgi:hypothetical protein